MNRSLNPEIIDDPNLPEETLTLVYRDLIRTHKFLGNVRALLLELGRHEQPLHQVLDIGCGRGEMLLEIQRKMRVEAVGVELRVPRTLSLAIRVVQADAVRDPLPSCDAAVVAWPTT
jgi:tRNA G46 methylase TrmB